MTYKVSDFCQSQTQQGDVVPDSVGPDTIMGEAASPVLFTFW